ncbi:MAG TPA: methyltransferase domain-containing protein [Candidatus Dormibacteraeota bacterium]|nr:methyltransferase domain-containing protein [Candidatus Dormibacteraeota bacterium]
MNLDLSSLTPSERCDVHAYWRYHARRFAVLRSIVAKVVPNRRARILDIGPNVQTALLREALPDARVDTMGFAHPLVPPREGEQHVEVDLNEAVWDVRTPARSARTAGPDLEESYDVVVLAEVIEHLHVPAQLTMSYCATLLRPSGTLIVQTPNAVALHKRVRMLLGASPFEPLRLSRDNPGHFHEYTLTELDEAARPAGLEPTGVITANYFGNLDLRRRGYAALGRVLPPSLRHGITAWYTRRVRA